MRIVILTCFLCFVGHLCVVAQPQGFSKTLLDSLEKKLATLPNDTNRVNTLTKIAVIYSNTNVEKSILLGEEALKLSRKLNYAEGLRKILAPLSFQYSISGQWAKGLELALEGKERYKNDLYALGNYINMAKLAYEKQGDYKRCLEECHENIRMFKNHPEIAFNPVHKWASYMTASHMYCKMQQADSALIYAFKCLSCAQSIKFNATHFLGYAHNTIGIGYLAQNKPDSAIAHLHIMRSAMEQTNNPFTLQETQIYLANAMQMKGVLDSMHYYAKTAYDGAAKMGNDVNEMNAALILSAYFEKSNPTKSLFYLKRHNAIKEKLFTQDQTNKRYFLESEQRKKLTELEKKEINAKNRIRQNALLGGLFTFILLAGVLIFTNRRKKALNDTLQQQKLQIENQNQDLINSGRELALKNRDLEIEGALEKVRSRSLIMQHSDEIQEVAYTLYNELKNLNFQFGACSVYLIDSDDNIEAWVAGFDAGEFPLKLFVPKFSHPLYAQQIKAFHEGKNFETLYLTPDIKQAYDDQMFLHTDYVKLKLELIQMMRGLESAVFSLAYNKYGALHWGPGELTEEEKSILLKFSLVFEQAYTRYLDIKKAEAQAREAQIEASLERIRSRAMAMNTSEELSTLIGFIYTEYTKLNMQLDRGFIMTFDTITKDAHWWMVSADAPDMPLKILVKHHEHAPNLAILKGWEEREQRWSYVLEDNNKKTWDDYQFANSLAQLPDFVKDNMRSVKSVILNASFQNFGCIMLSSFEPLSEDHFDLLIRLSKVFDLTYIRFLDLQLKEQNALKLAEEKLKLELTLSELRATQAQLIQSEKLASLGELTAGIAHEIQNPLNFVNNFAEVSAEMIDELKEELEKGDMEEVKAIAEDLQVNLGKINHHGGRASSIVKGMLEHSRTSSGVKELTNLNTLADEFLRLAYHGLRAKDSSFNCKMETHFDPDLLVVSVISQDIGRVLLNLINNAFYAVAERSRSTVGAPLAGAPAPYQPTVTVSTQKTDNQIIIKVMDNGNGIPEAIRDKIFQPFFTTKPTGQGTGLGLSLAYDIITKGHGGKIHLESAENQGSTFTIELPFTNPKN